MILCLPYYFISERSLVCLAPTNIQLFASQHKAPFTPLAHSHSQLTHDHSQLTHSHSQLTHSHSQLTHSYSRGRTLTPSRNSAIQSVCSQRGDVCHHLLHEASLGIEPCCCESLGQSFSKHRTVSCAHVLSCYCYSFVLLNE